MLAIAICSCVSTRPAATESQRSISAMTTGVLRGPTLQLQYIESPGEGTSIILLHGLGGNALWWSGLIKALPNRHFICLDLPGHGESPPTQDWAIQPMASEIAALVSSRWPGSHLWGGHSWGGKLAILAAASARDSTLGLMLMDPVPVTAIKFPDLGAIADWLFGAELKTWRNMDDAIQAVRILPQYQTWTTELERGFRHGLLVQEGGRVTPILTRDRAITILDALYSVDITERAQSLEIPILLVIANESRQFQAPNSKVFTRAKQVIVPGNHWINVNSIDALASAISEWLIANHL